jgi:hypothetical protein
VRLWLVERVRQWSVEKKRKQKPPAVVVVPSKVGRELDEDGAAGVGVEELVAAAEVAWKNKQIHMKLRQVTIECCNQGAPKDCSQLIRTNLDRSSRGHIDIPGACTWALGTEAYGVRCVTVGIRWRCPQNSSFAHWQPTSGIDHCQWQADLAHAARAPAPPSLGGFQAYDLMSLLITFGAPAQLRSCRQMCR